MSILPTITVKKALAYGLAAAGLAVGIWLGGYTWFINSNEWKEISIIISESKRINSKVGEVREISTSPFGFSYRFSGDLINIKALKQMLYTFQDMSLPVTNNRLLLIGIFQTMTVLSEEDLEFSSKFYALSYSANDIRFLINESLVHLEKMFRQNLEKYLATSVEGIEALVLTVWYSESEQERARQQR